PLPRKHFGELIPVAESAHVHGGRAFLAVLRERRTSLLEIGRGRLAKGLGLDRDGKAIVPEKIERARQVADHRPRDCEIEIPELELAAGLEVLVADVAPTSD